MQNQKKECKDWTKVLQNHRQDCDLLYEDIGELKKEYRDDDHGRAFVQGLEEKVLRIRREADWLHETMCAVPIRRMFSTDRMNLSRQQYFFLRATGLELFTAKRLGISPVDDYEVYRHCCYKDDEKVCFMDPNETPQVETVDGKTGRRHIRLRLVRSPEELKLKHLRPEQKKFFQELLPEVYDRFQTD